MSTGKCLIKRGSVKIILHDFSKAHILGNSGRFFKSHAMPKKTVQCSRHISAKLTYDTLFVLRISGDQRRGNLQLTFPTPLMTPPDTSTYFMIAAFSALIACGEGEGRKES
jgi:hypothetical protein